MNPFLNALSNILARVVSVALVYYILKLIFHYTCTPFEVYVILVLQGIGADIVYLSYPPAEE